MVFPKRCGYSLVNFECRQTLTEANRPKKLDCPGQCCNNQFTSTSKIFILSAVFFLTEMIQKKTRWTRARNSNVAQSKSNLWLNFQMCQISFICYIRFANLTFLYILFWLPSFYFFLHLVKNNTLVIFFVNFGNFSF